MAMYIFALLMLQQFLTSVMPMQAVLALMKMVYIKCIPLQKLVYIKCISATKGGGKIPTPTQAGIDKCAVLT